MGTNTKIEWATHTFNPWRGCVKVAAGCEHCYAAEQAKRNPAVLGKWGVEGTRVIASEAMWRQPIKWSKAVDIACNAWSYMMSEGTTEADLLARGHEKPETPRVFCGSMCDVFEDWGNAVRNARGEPLHDEAKWLRGATGTGGAAWLGVANQFIGRSLIRMADVRARLFQLIDATPSLDWLLLTKRPENVRRMWPCPECRKPECGGSAPKRRSNVWLGTSIACQEDADRNIPELLKCRDLAEKLFVSIEPLIGPVNFRWAKWCPIPFDARTGKTDELDGLRMIDWVIVGGESGPQARPCNVAWIRSIVEQCHAAGVPVFVKQLGATVYDNSGESRCAWPGLTQFQHHNSDADDEVEVMLDDSKGGDPSEWPADLRVREVPHD